MADDHATCTHPVLECDCGTSRAPVVWRPTRMMVARRRLHDAGQWADHDYDLQVAAEAQLLVADHHAAVAETVTADPQHVADLPPEYVALTVVGDDPPPDDPRDPVASLTAAPVAPPAVARVPA